MTCCKSCVDLFFAHFALSARKVTKNVYADKAFRLVFNLFLQRTSVLDSKCTEKKNNVYICSQKTQ